MPTTRSQSVSQARSDNTRKKRSRAVKRRSSIKGKTTIKGAIRVGEHGEEREAKKRNPGREEEEEEEEELSVSSTPSSPLLEPCVSDDADSSAPRVIKAYELARNKFREKKARHARMLTLQRSRPCPLFNGDELLPIREPAKRAVLSAAKFVIGLSSFVGSVLGMDNWVRITFAIDSSSLQDGLERIKNFCQRHKKKNLIKNCN